MSTNKRLLMDKIIDILDSIAFEKGLKIDDVENALKEALIKTAQKMVDETLTFDANIDRANKKLELFQKIEVVNQDDERLLANAVNKYGEALNFENYITLEEAKEVIEFVEQEKKWDEYIDALENLPEDIKVLGINDYWFLDGYKKVLEYKDWRNFLKVLNKAKDACKNSGFNIDEQLVEHNKLSKRNN